MVILLVRVNKLPLNCIRGCPIMDNSVLFISSVKFFTPYIRDEMVHLANTLQFQAIIIFLIISFIPTPLYDLQIMED